MIKLFYIIVLLIPALLFSDSTKAQSWKELDSIAYYYLETNVFDSALYFADKALMQGEKEFGKEDTNYAISLVTRAYSLNEMGKYSDCENIYLEALRIWENKKGKKNAFYASILSYFAIHYKAIGDFDKAESIYLEAVSIYKEIHYETNSDYAQVLNSLANLYKRENKYSKAEPLFIESASIVKKELGDADPNYGTAINNLGLFYNDLANYEKAEPLLLEAMKIYKNAYGEKNPLYGLSLSNLSTLYTQSGKYDVALQYCLNAKSIFENAFGKEHPSYGATVNTLAGIYIRLNKYEKADSLYNELMDFFDHSMGKESMEYSSVVNNQATLFQTTHQYAKAEAKYLEGISIQKAKLGDKNPDYAFSLNDLASLYFDMKNYTKAEQIFKEMLGIQLNEIQNNIGFMSETEKLKYLDIFNKNFFCFYSFALKTKKENPAIVADVYNTYLILKGLLLSDAIHLQKQIAESKDSTLINLYGNWKEEKQLLAKYSQMSKSRLEKKKINLDSLENVAFIMEKELCRRSSDFFKNLKTNNLGWTAIQEKLKKDEAAIEILSFRNYNVGYSDTIFYCALVVRPEYKYPEMIYLFEENQLKSILNRMADYRGIQMLEQPVTVEKSKELFDLVWKPIDPFLQNVKTVFFAPEGLLTKVSFASFTYPDGKFLFDKYKMQNLFSTKSIASDKSEMVFSKDMNSVIYGGLQYVTDLTSQLKITKQYQDKDISTAAFIDNVDTKDFSRGGEWVYLKGTLTEAEQIDKIMLENKVKTTLLSGDNGVEESFKALSGKSPSLIHIATHGFYINNEGKDPNTTTTAKNERNPLFRSGLIMSGANRAWTGKNIPDGLDDGILTAYEVSMLDLSNTKLVVLSACETGLGDIKGSEGVYGLQRAFKIAGVKYIIMTLWQIRDEVTVEFMSEFYKSFMNGNEIHAAFKSAQDKMRKKYEANYWAAFVLLE